MSATATEGSTVEPTVEAARALIPEIRASREEIDAGRTLPAHLVEALRGIGVWRMTQPRSWGGPEVDIVTQFEIFEALAEGDGSVGWNAYIGSTSGYWSSFLEDGVGRDLYPDLDLITAGSIPPRGRATIVADGYRIDGRFPFGSGVKHSDYMVSGCFVHDENGPRVGPNGMPEFIACYVRADELEVIENWSTLGLCGTGSHDYVVSDVFVPAELTFNPLTSPQLRPGPLYAARNLFQFCHSAIPIGVARAAIEEATGLIEGKQTMTGAPLSADGSVRESLARAEAALGSARSYCLAVVSDLWATLERGEEPSPRQRALYRLAIANAHEAPLEAIELVAYLVGTTAIRTPGTIERSLRDASTARQHVVASTSVFQGVGAMLLGGPAPDPLY